MNWRESTLIRRFPTLAALTKQEKRLIHFGALEGQGWIAEDFDDPLPPEIQALFDGSDESNIE